MKSVHLFLDLGAGLYLFNFSNVSTRFGLSTGIGAIYNINEKTDFIFKAKYHPFMKKEKKDIMIILSSTEE